MVATIAFGVAQIYENLGEYERAEAAYLEAEAVYKIMLGTTHWWRAFPLLYLGELLVEQGEAARALPYLQEGLALCRSNALSEKNLLFIRGNAALGAGLAQLGQFAQAERLLKATHQTIETNYQAIKDAPGGQSLLFDTLKHLIALYDLWQEPEKAEQYRNMLNQVEASAQAEASTQATE